MKFGKLICDARDLSMPEWRSKWMDYKALKTILKSIPLKPESVGPDELANQLSSSPTEVSFFTLLKEELKKVSEFYLQSESGMLSAYKTMVSQLNAYKERLRTADESEAMAMLGNVVKFYMDLLLLENFAVINYCGFGKILKKHDKVTGYVTKEAYMQRMVNPQEFTHYPRLMRMLRYTEQSYQLLLHTYPSEARATLLSAESRMRLLQLEKVKAHSAAQKQSETSAQSNQEHSTTPKSGAPARSFSPPSDDGSAARRATEECVANADDTQSFLGGSASQVAARIQTKSESGSVKGSHVGDMELSAAQALVAVAADVGSSKPSHKPTPASVSTGYSAQHQGPAASSFGSHYAHGPMVHTYVSAPMQQFQPAGVPSGGYSYMPPGHMVHAHRAPHDPFMHGHGYSMHSARSAHSGRSVVSVHSHHSGHHSGPHSGMGVPSSHGPPYAHHQAPHPHHMSRMYEPHAAEHSAPLHPALAASAAGRWRTEQHAHSYAHGPAHHMHGPPPGAGRYAPGVVPGQLQR